MNQKKTKHTRSELFLYSYFRIKLMMKNHVIENDIIVLDHHQSNVIDINDQDHVHDQDHVIIDRNIIDIVDHVHHDGKDQDRDHENVHHHHHDDDLVLV